MRMINLLPWRQQRRARCLRFWGTLSLAAWMLVIITACAIRMNNAVMLPGLQTQLSGIQSVRQVLAARQRPATPAEMPAPAPQRRSWQPLLESLSRIIPAQAWLTELRYQPPSLVFIGYATALPALSSLRDALKDIAGFTPGPAGELQQDPQGRWMFTLQLKSQG